MKSPNKRVLASLKNSIQEKRTQYAEAWVQSAKNHQANNDYDWMASNVNGFHTLLEVGTGDGSSTLTLAKNGHKIIGLDENIECLNKTYEKLKHNNISVTILRREEIKLSNKNDYKIMYSKIYSKLDNFQVVLIEGDILNDPNFLDWLKNQTNIDGVVCWLIGSHGARSMNEAVRSVTPGNYRFEVQNRVYEIADEILRPGGLLNIIDRGQTPSNQIGQESILNSHKEQASVTSLEVRFINLKQIDFDIMISNGVRMGLTVGPGAEIPEIPDVSLISISSFKP